jgi:hypothetical protein
MKAKRLFGFATFAGSAFQGSGDSGADRGEQDVQRRDGQ